MPLSHAFILGLLQGLAEFLPISSSAHLSLAPVVFGWSADPGLAFDVALHLGTLITLLWYFRADWVALTRSALGLVVRRRVETDDDRRVLFLVFATIPGAIAGKLLEDKAETVFRAPTLTAVMLIVAGLLLWIADRVAARDRGLGEMRASDAWLIGLAQVAALVPGVSRSGSTMTAGRALRFDRPAAARFSFLMSMPITAAAVILKAPEAMRVEGLGVPVAVGVVTAAVSSWAAIAFLLRYLARHSFGVFAAYRVVLGAAVLALIATGVRSGGPNAGARPSVTYAEPAPAGR
jgi:undecaprenyl-diphosphatase